MEIKGSMDQESKTDSTEPLPDEARPEAGPEAGTEIGRKAAVEAHREQIPYRSEPLTHEAPADPSRSKGTSGLGIFEVLFGQREILVIAVMTALVCMGYLLKSCLSGDPAIYVVTAKSGQQTIELMAVRLPSMWKAEPRPVSPPRVADVTLFSLAGAHRYPARLELLVEKMPSGVPVTDPQAVAVYFMANARHDRPMLHMISWYITSVGGQRCLRADYAYAANPVRPGSEVPAHTDIPVVVRGTDLFFGIRDLGYHVSLKVQKQEYEHNRERYEALLRSVDIKQP